ncbi:hypothetical protein DXG01_002510 [Tephrocybe rancida]|nr:hypothetical protein DXG01_002510 [Tephrocybe rancida]
MPEHTKKRKQTKPAIDVEKPAKKSKKEKRDKKDKGKARDTEFHVVKTSLVVSIAPTFAANPRAGVEEMLDSMVMRDEWEFEYGPAENDPEFGPDANAEEGEEGTSKKAEDGGGKWVHHLTRAKLGDVDGYLTFTVIGLTVANEMLSLLGSIQSDPFSPEHVPESGPAAKASPGDSELERAEVANEIELGEEAEEDELDSDEDTFQTLGKTSDEAAAAEAARRDAAAAAALAEKEKKRKRKEGKADRAAKKAKKQKGNS